MDRIIYIKNQLNVLIRIIFLSMFLFVTSTPANCCIKYEQNLTCKTVPSLYEQALNKLLDREQISTTIQKLRELHLLACSSNPEVGDHMSGRNLFFIRSFMLRLLSKNERRVLKIPDSGEQARQLLPQKKGLSTKHLFVTGRTDGILELIDIKTKNRIAKVDTKLRAFSCLTSKSEILATANVDVKKIQLWKICNLELLGEIITLLPTVFMQIVDNVLIVLNSAGCLDFYDLDTKNMLCNLTTGINGNVLEASWDKDQAVLSIKTFSGIYFLSIGDLILFDRLIHNLRVDQMIFLAYIFNEKFNTGSAVGMEDQGLLEIFNSMPKEIQAIIIRNHFFLDKAQSN